MDSSNNDNDTKNSDNNNGSDNNDTDNCYEDIWFLRVQDGCVDCHDNKKRNANTTTTTTTNNNNKKQQQQQQQHQTTHSLLPFVGSVVWAGEGKNTAQTKQHAQTTVNGQ